MARSKWYMSTYATHNRRHSLAQIRRFRRKTPLLKRIFGLTGARQIDRASWESLSDRERLGF